MTCPNCGGKLQITIDMDRFACGYCGTEHIVRRSGGTISLAPVVEGLKNVQKGVDKTASELAIVRLKEKIKELSLDCDELKNKVDNEKNSLFFGFLLFGVGFIIAVLIPSIPWIIIFGALSIGMFILMLRVKGNEKLMQTKELIKKYQEKMQYHEDIVK
jgi:hypothetical protein